MITFVFVLGYQKLFKTFNFFFDYNYTFTDLCKYSQNYHCRNAASCLRRQDMYMKGMIFWTPSIYANFPG